MKYIVIILLLIGFLPSLYSQFSIFEMQQLKEAGYYTEALNELSETRKKERTADYYAVLAELSYDINDYTAALEYFNKIENIEKLNAKQKEILFETLRINQQYDKASKLVAEVFSNNSAKIKNDFITYPTTNNLIKNEITLKEVPLDFGKKFMGLGLNNNGELLITKAVNSSDSKYDIFCYGITKDNVFEDKKNERLKENKSDYIYRANPTFIDNNNYVYTKSIVDYTSYKTKKIDKVVTNNLLKLFEYNTIDKTEKELNVFNSNTTNTVTPFYCVKEQFMLYSLSNAVNEDFDIFYSKKSGNNWSEPKKIEGVNTNFNEVYPVIKGNTLYFSSRGHENYGGLDVFKVTIEFNGNEILVKSIPKNIGMPINSSFDDFGLVYINDTAGFLASNRNGNNGEDRLYRFIDKSMVNVLYTVKDNSGFIVKEADIKLYRLDENNNKILISLLKSDEQGKFTLTLDVYENYLITVDSEGYKSEEKLIPANSIQDNEDKEVILNENQFKGFVKDEIAEQGLDKVTVLVYELNRTNNKYNLVDSITTNDSGKWEYPFNRNNDYKVEINKLDYELETFLIPSVGNNRESILSLLADVSLIKIVKKDDVFKINNITFDLNSSFLTKESYPILDNVINFLIKNPTVKIELSAHTDCEANDNYNLWLSRKRAKSCFNYITNQGISPKRLTPVGYGEKYILNGCTQEGQCTEQENRINRRVEIKILSTK